MVKLGCCFATNSLRAFNFFSVVRRQTFRLFGGSAKHRRFWVFYSFATTFFRIAYFNWQQYLFNNGEGDSSLKRVSWQAADAHNKQSVRVNVLAGDPISSPIRSIIIIIIGHIFLHPIRPLSIPSSASGNGVTKPEKATRRTHRLLLLTKKKRRASPRAHTICLTVDDELCGTGGGGGVLWPN